MQDGQAYLFYGGAGDIFEATAGMMALQHSQNPDVRGFATMIIGDHTGLTNSALATARAAGIMAPPPVLSPPQMGMITQLTTAGPNFDRIFLQQQVAAHEMALAMQQGYAASGDVPALRQAASRTIPVVQAHLARLRQLQAAMR